MSYHTVNGKLVKRERLKRREPVREPIKTKYQRELFMPGPVRDMAKAIAKQQLFKEMRAKGKDPRLATPREIDNGITILLFNAGEYYLNKAKDALT
jgi:hypothetical protein